MVSKITWSISSMFSAVCIDISLTFVHLGQENFWKTVRDPPFYYLGESTTTEWNIKEGAFTPLVFSATGGMGPECTWLNKQLAELIYQKTGEMYAHPLLRATVIAVRGHRGQKDQSEELEIKDISFNVIPEMKGLWMFILFWFYCK